MSKPQLLDLFCGGGGASMGYFQAGFEVIGVDLTPQKNYPFEFHQADAMTFPLDGFAVIHASPPCQRWSGMAACRPGLSDSYPALIDGIRERLRGRVSVIENVTASPLSGITLCGQMFGLRLYRHRRFECSKWLWNPGHPRHEIPASKAGHWRPGDDCERRGELRADRRSAGSNGDRVDEPKRVGRGGSTGIHALDRRATMQGAMSMHRRPLPPRSSGSARSFVLCGVEAMNRYAEILKYEPITEGPLEGSYRRVEEHGDWLTTTTTNRAGLDYMALCASLHERWSESLEAARAALPLLCAWHRRPISDLSFDLNDYICQPDKEPRFIDWLLSGWHDDDGPFCVAAHAHTTPSGLVVAPW